MKFNTVVLSLIASAALAQAAAILQCDEDLQFYNHCIEDSSKYLKSLNVRVIPENNSRITKCYHCFQEAAAEKCGKEFGSDPDNLSDEGRACYDVRMEKCRTRRRDQCNFFLNWNKPLIKVEGS